MTARSISPKTRDSHSGDLDTYHRPLIPVAFALAGGILAGGSWPGYLSLAMLLGTLALGRVVFAWYHSRKSPMAPLLLMSMLGYALISPWLPSELPENHIGRYTDSQRWRVEGMVTESLPVRHGRTRLIIQVTRLSDPLRAIAVTGRIRLTIAGEAPVVAPGFQVAFTSRIRSFHNFNNPGGFDYRRHMLFQKIYGSAFVGADRLHITAAPKTFCSTAIADYRSRAGAVIERIADPTTQSVLKALLIGDRQAIPPDVRRGFNRCGVGHLLAISGLHIGIVGGLVFAFFHWGLNRWHVVLDRGWGRRGATLMAMGPVLFYAVLAGLSPATQRALIMVLAFMTTYFIFKEGDTLNFLALAAVLMLIWDPPALFSISFQMSFAAVFWILVGLSISRHKQVSNLNGIPKVRRRFLIFLWVTFWATAGTLPLAMAYFSEVSLIGLVANCIMVPLTGLFVLPCGLFAIFILPLHEILAVGGIQVAGWGLSHALHLLKFLAAFDGVALSTFVPTVLEIVCYYGLLGLIPMRQAVRPPPWLILVLGVAIVADGVFWLHERFWHDDLRVTVLDVGQGSSALVEFPGGETLLIDGGGYTDNRYFDIGQRIIAPFLRYRKILRLDTIVLSHPSSDHMNGLVFVLSHFHPRKLLWTGDRASTASLTTFLQAVEDSGVQVPVFTQMDRVMTIGGVDVAVLHPVPNDWPSHRDLTGEDSNNRSIVLKLTMGECGILFPGDIEVRAEAQLIDCCRQDLKSHILVAPHHGSRTSSSMGFLEAVRPQGVVISAGWQNRFGFPHRSVLERYRNLTAQIYRTDRHGAVMLRSDGRQWQVATQLE